MKGRILPLDDIAQHDRMTVILTLSLSPDEARQILSHWENPRGPEEGGPPVAVRLLAGYLSVVAEPARQAWNQDVSNTDGRWLAVVNHNTVTGHPIQGSIGETQSSNIHPGVLARRVAEEMSTHGPHCNCEWHRVSRGGR